MNQTTDPTTRRSAQHEPRRVIVGGSYWTLNGVNVFSQNLVRGLRAQGIDAEILLTEENSRLVTINDAPMPRPRDIPMTALPVPHGASWGRHWGAMIRYLEDHAPCVYIPNSDWRHSSVSPLLSAGVHIVGVVHSDDPLHYDHVHRLGAYWDAIVTTSPFIARKTIAQNPEVAERTQVIPIGVDIPADVPARTRTPGQPVRVIYAGTLKLHQKRVLDLPKIVEAAARRRVPMTLTIAGGGPDEAQLRAACAPWVAEGLIHFLGVVEQRAVLDLLAAHDVFIMTSEFEGLPNALLEAMGRGCVPVVTDIDSGIPDVVEDGTSGYLVPVGEIETFVDRLEHLWRHDEQRRHMSAAAHTAVISGRFRVTDMVDSYAALCEQLLREADSAAYRRPLGELNHPPAEIGGVGLFPVALTHDLPGVGAFPSRLPDAREFLAEIRQLSHPEHSPLRPLVEQLAYEARILDNVQVIVASPAWVPSGLNEFSATLVRDLLNAGVDARILLTEEDTDLVDLDEPSQPVPPDIPFDRLPVERADSWGAHWGAMIRYLEDRAPCIYLPMHDWRHSVVSPLLSDQVAIIGIVPGRDVMHEDHVRRLGAFWNAVVAWDADVAHALAEDPALAARLYTVPGGGDNMALDYVEVFRRVVQDVRSRTFRRPPGTFMAPPRSVAGIGVLPTEVGIAVGTTADQPTGTDPISIRNDRDFRTQIRRVKQPERSPLSRIMLRKEVEFDRLRGMQVILGLPRWTTGGIEESSAVLVRGLAARGVDAHVLLTEEDTDLMTRRGTSLSPPSDVTMVRLPVGRTEDWSAHWRCMIQYLESRAPCIYMPNHDWRHSFVTPALSGSVVVIGVVHDNDAMHLDHAHLLGRYWNAAVTYGETTACALAADPELASRVNLLPFETNDIARDYLDVFDRALIDVETGRFRRPAGTVRPPPRALGGVNLFSTE